MSQEKYKAALELANKVNARTDDNSVDCQQCGGVILPKAKILAQALIEMHGEFEKVKRILLRVTYSDAVKEAPFYNYSQAIADAKHYFSQSDKLAGEGGK